MKVAECKRCGQCCHGLVDGSLVACQFLVELKDGTTFCKEYDDRLGMVVAVDSKGRESLCKMRVDHPWDYPGCPLNRNRPIAPYVLKGLR